MPFCPRCRAEYRAGFRRCSDCGEVLVPSLPPEEPRKINELVPICELENLYEGDQITRQLEKHGILSIIEKGMVLVEAKDEERAAEIVKVFIAAPPICGACGSEQDFEAKFCDQCGAKLPPPLKE